MKFYIVQLKKKKTKHNTICMRFGIFDRYYVVDKLITSNKSMSNSQVIITNDMQEKNNYVVDYLK